jgi:hypothetical protein
MQSAFACPIALFLTGMCPPCTCSRCLPLQGNLTTRFMATCLMAVARIWRLAPRWLQVATSWPIRKLSGVITGQLPRQMAGL